MTIIVSLYKIIRAFFHKVKEDYVSAFAAQTAFYVLISFFPFIMFLLTLMEYLPFSAEAIITNISEVLPSSIRPLITTVVNEVFQKASGTLISVTAITALWTSSKGILSIIKGLNAVYGIKESRSFIRIRILANLYTFIFAIMLIISICFLVFGNQIFLWVENRFPLLEELAFLIISLRTAVGLLILSVFFLLIYTVIPNRTTTLWKELPGAIVSSTGWMGFSYLYSYYIDHMSNSAKMYGSLTAIVLFLLWFYFCLYILFIGAEINIVLSSGDLVYYIKYIFKNRKNLSERRLTVTSTSLRYHDDDNDPINFIIDKTMKDPPDSTK